MVFEDVTIEQLAKNYNTLVGDEISCCEDNEVKERVKRGRNLQEAAFFYQNQLKSTNRSIKQLIITLFISGFIVLAPLICIGYMTSWKYGDYFK